MIESLNIGIIWLLTAHYTFLMSLICTPATKFDTFENHQVHITSRSLLNMHWIIQWKKISFRWRKLEQFNIFKSRKVVLKWTVIHNKSGFINLKNFTSNSTFTAHSIAYLDKWYHLSINVKFKKLAYSLLEIF